MAGLLGLGGCTPEDLTKGVSIAIDIDSFSTRYMVMATDASDGSLVADATIEFSGQNANKVFDISGNPSILMEDGIAAFGLHPALNPTESNPVFVSMTISAPNYISKVVEVEFNGSPTTNLEVHLINESNPPSNSAFIKESFSLTGGTLAQAETISADVSGSHDLGFSVTIPAGVQFFDANNQQINGNNLEVSLLHFDSDADIFSQVPLENGVYRVKNSEGIVTEGAPFGNGMADLNMFVDGTEVKSFSSGITITQGIPTTVNTGNYSHAVGDTISVFSQSGNGLIEFDLNTFVTNGTNGLEITYQLDHLSRIVTHYFGGYFSRRAYTYCEQDFLLDCPIVQTVSLELYNRHDGAMFFKSANKTIDLGETIKLGHHFGAGASADYKIVDFNGNLLASGSTPTECTDILITLPTTPKDIVSLDHKITCPTDPSQVYRASYPVFMFGPGGLTDNFQFLGWAVNGQGTTDVLEIGKSYNFITFYDGGTIHPNFLIDDALIDFYFEDEKVCED